MHIKALTAGLVLAAITAVGSAGHAEAISQTTTVSSKKHKVTKVKVEPGDNLSKIAKRHGTTYVRLFDANTQIKDPDLIYPGQAIRIPTPGEKLPHRSKPAPAPSPKPTAAPKPQASVSKPAPATPAVHATGSGVWYGLAQCESGGNWVANTGNGYYGGLQFTLSSWRAAGGSGYPHQASASEQIARAKVLQARQGWGAWPACSAKLGLI
ncbi:MAG TPA: transglycosylase family protein [Candidatus Saccharimonadales bacterium]|nr:transglycosylase family protein [Candidatus Saccharimonadales bacterium]